MGLGFINRLSGLFFILILAGSFAEGTEPVVNGGFEENLKGWVWMTYGGAKATCRVEPVAGCEGKKALRLSSGSEFAPHVAGVLHQTVTGLLPKTTYKITARFKGKQIGQAWVGGGNWDVHGYFWLGDVDEWQETSVSFTTGENQTTFALMISVEGKTQALWVDGIRMVNSAVERVDQAETSLRQAMVECEKSLSQVTLTPGLAGELKANCGETKKQLALLTQRRIDLEKVHAAMPNGEQDRWAEKLLTLRSRIDGVTIWTEDAMKDVKPTMMPAALASIESLRWPACINEHAPVVVNITNLVGSPALDLRVVLTAFVPKGMPSVSHRLGDWNPDESRALRAYNGTDGQIPASQIVLREAVPIRKAGGEWTGDPLAELGQARRMIIPVGQTRQLWLDVVTNDLKPGLYQANLSFVPTDPMSPQTPRTITLELEVLPVPLPKRMPIHVFNFDYGLSANPNCLADLVDHRVNVFDVLIACDIPAAPTPMAFKFLDGYIANAKRFDAALMIENAAIHRGGWKPGYDAWFRAMFKYLRDAGLRDDQYFMHLADEQLSPEFLTAARAVKAIDPKVRIFADPYQTDYDEKTYETFMPVIDIWCPKTGLLNYWIAGKPKIMEMIRANHKELWIYECNSGKSNESAISNRVLGWLAFKYNLQGVAAWTYSTTDYGDPWGANSSWEKIYPLSDGVTVPSRRWEAWREGLEDYCLLSILKQRINDKSNKKMFADEYRRAKKIIDDAVTAVTENNQDADLLARQRGRLIELAKTLLKSEPR